MRISFLYEKQKEDEEMICEGCMNWRDRFDQQGVGCPLDDLLMDGCDREMLANIVTMEGVEVKRCSMYLRHEKCV